MGRRNIATIDKIALAELASEMIREKARRREHAGRPAKEASVKLRKDNPVHVSVELANLAGISQPTFDAGYRREMSLV